MEEKKNQNPQKPLTREELNQKLSDLYIQYQKLSAEYQKAMEALQNRDFEYTSFILQAMFRVLDHPEQYSPEFTKWCSENIEASLRSFIEAAKSGAEGEKKSENEAE